MPAGGGVAGNPFRTEGGAPTQNISEKPEPTVGAPAPGAKASRRRRSCRQTRFAPGRCSYTEHIGEARTPRRSTRPGCECNGGGGVAGNPVRTGGGAPTWGMAQVHGVQPGAKAYPMTPPLLTLYTWRL